MEPNEQAGMNGQEPGPIEYSEPVCWCESTGRYTNPQGQELELRVRGTNSDIVEDYMKVVRISFEVRREGEETPDEEPAKEEDERYRDRIDAEFKKLELRPELDLDIELDVVNTQGIELPYELNVVVDPPIAQGATHNYKTKKKAKKLKVTLRCSDGGVYGLLTGSGIASKSGQADIDPPDPPSKKAQISSDEVDPAIDFYFSVTGLNDENTYTYNPSSKLVKD